MNIKALESKIFNYQNSILHYYKHGSGVKILICFHGFGQNALVYQSLAQRLSTKYTLYSFDLFYHGLSQWQDCEIAISPELLSEMLKAWLISEKIDCISLCGYSMGGKIVLSLVENLNVQLEKLLFIAPDGIQTHFWYNMATYPYWARSLFKYTIDHPAFFLRSVNLLGKIGVLDRGVVRFAKSQMNNAQKRRKVYCTWLTYRHIKPNIEQVAKICNDSGVDLTIYLGRYDRIISENRIKPLIRQVKNHKLYLLERGHNTLIEDVALDKNFEF